jgi:hypothetical protein
LNAPVSEEVALHIDDCATCSNRAIALDPLASAFAAIEEPAIPQALNDRLRFALTYAPPAQPEWIAAGGVALLAAAAVLLTVLGDPSGLMSEAGTTLFASTAGVTALSGTLFDHPLSLIGLGALLCVATLGAVLWLGFSKDD